jgi:hypothetical protein
MTHQTAVAQKLTPLCNNDESTPSTSLIAHAQQDALLKRGKCCRTSTYHPSINQQYYYCLGPCTGTSGGKHGGKGGLQACCLSSASRCLSCASRYCCNQSAPSEFPDKAQAVPKGYCNVNAVRQHWQCPQVPPQQTRQHRLSHAAKPKYTVPLTLQTCSVSSTRRCLSSSARRCPSSIARRCLCSSTRRCWSPLPLPPTQGGQQC